jgi:hypothetical protein
MLRSFGLATVLGTALGAGQLILPRSGDAHVLVPRPGNGEIAFGAPGRLGLPGFYSLTHASGNAIQFDTGLLPIRSLGANDIRPVSNPLDPENMVCCPPGTVFNGESCVFLASQICPRGFNLDPETKTVCISTTPPCPDDLRFEDGLCVSPESPHCEDPTAVFDLANSQCVSTSKPVCDAPLQQEGPDCVSLTGPSCLPGFEPRDARCVSRTGPTCNSPDLVVDKSIDGRLICVSKDLPQCPDGNGPVDGQCVSKKAPHCPDGFKPEGGDCISKDPPCPLGSVFTEFTDNRDPVCKTIEDAVCDFGGVPQGTQCVSKEPACRDGYDIDEKTGLCIHTDSVVCETGRKAFPTTSGYSDARVVCCPDVEGMTMDEYDQCRVPATHEGCPAGMEADPDNDELCAVAPTDADCPKGQYDSDMGRCVEVTEPKCTVGTPDARGQCVLKKTCSNPDAEYDEKSDSCVLKEKPKCPPGTALSIGKNCFAAEAVRCPADTKLSSDGKSCVYKALPKCKDPEATYDKDRHLCVHPNKVECAAGTGHLVGDDCVSSGPPVCSGGADVSFDPQTGKCVSVNRPQCNPGFHLPPSGTQCVSDEPPKCPGGAGFELEDGKCVSSEPPKCPAGSKWINSKKACVSDSGPCAEGTPDINGNCIAKEAPSCKDPKTEFTPGIGCVAVDDKPKCSAPGTKLNAQTLECEAETGPDCAAVGPNLRLEDGRCVSVVPPHCPGETEPTPDGRCVAKARPVCDGNHTLDAEHNVCVGPAPKCPDGSALDEHKTKCVTTSSRTCFVMLACPDVEDDSAPAIAG